MVAAGSGCCSLVVRPEPWRRPVIKQKKEPLLRGLDDDQGLTELDEHILDAVAGKEDIIGVFSLESFFQSRLHLDELELIRFFYNVGSHNAWF